MTRWVWILTCSLLLATFSGITAYALDWYSLFGEIGKTDCASCHITHGAMAGSSLIKDNSGTWTEVNDLCIDCHEKTLAEKPGEHAPAFAECQCCQRNLPWRLACSTHVPLCNS